MCIKNIKRIDRESMEVDGETYVITTEILNASSFDCPDGEVEGIKAIFYSNGSRVIDSELRNRIMNTRR